MSGGSHMQGDFVMLRAGRLRLVLPQAEVGAAEYLESRPVATATRGLFLVAGEAADRRYAALSQEMTLLPDVPAERFVVAELPGDGAKVAWCWDELRVLIGAKLQPTEVPSVLLAPDAPVSQYVELDGEVAFVCSAAAIGEFALSDGRHA